MAILRSWAKFCGHQYRQENSCDVEAAIPLRDTNASATDAYLELIRVLGSVNDVQHVPKEFSNWYSSFLEKRLNQISPEIIDSILTADDRSSARSKYVKSCRVLTEIVLSVARSKDLTVVGIVSDLETKQMIQIEHGNESHVNQMVFIALGLTTLLYNPLLAPSRNKYELVHLPADDGRRSRRSNDRTWRSFSQAAEAEISISDLLYRMSARRGPIPCGFISTDDDGTDSVQATNINYYTLTKMAGLRIIWVESVCEHLEFDSQHKTVKLFRFPSFCAMMCTGDESDTFLCRFFNEHFRDRSISMASKQQPTLYAGDFFREVLLSYRLMFGQNKDSWGGYRSCYSSRLSRETQEADCDPLLSRLCSKSWVKEPLYSDIEAPNVRAVYSAKADFPYFGERLLILQDYIVTQVPEGFRSLWRDRRDVTRFWTFWAVVIFGGLAIIVGIIQIVLAAVQVAAALDPPGHNASGF